MTSYSGSVIAGDRVVPVEVELSVRFEPVDGRYHWGGRIAPNPAVAALVRAGLRSCELRVDSAAPARLGELDPWGGIRVSGVGPPPIRREATTSPEVVASRESQRMGYLETSESSCWPPSSP